MGKKILFAVMALLTMATGKIWAQTQGEGGTTTTPPTAYVVYNENNKTLYFLCDEQSDLTKITIDGKEIGLIINKNANINNCWKGNDVTNSPTYRTPDWGTKSDRGVTKVVFKESFRAAMPTSCRSWFEGFSELEQIEGLEYLNTSEVTDMSRMFEGCKVLDKLDLSRFNTSHVGNMSFMFCDCKVLDKLDLSSFDTSKVTNMSSMFSGCSGLTSLNLRSFNTSNVQSMNSMFSACSSLQSLDLRSFDTSIVREMDTMFEGCKDLKDLTIGSFDMSQVTSWDNMFYDVAPSNITIYGNALVFVATEDQKNIWKDFKEKVKLVVKNEDGTYNYDGDIKIDSEYIKETLNIPFNFTATSVTFTREFAKDKPHTICLPFAITNTTDYGTFYKYSGYDNGIVKFSEVTETEANKPYLFVPNEDKDKIVINGETIIKATKYVATRDGDFTGVYEKKIFTDTDLNGYNNYYGWAGGEFRKAGEGASVAPCRAYIMLKNETTGSNAPARLSVELGDGDTTGISTAGNGANGGEDAPVYNLQGQRVGSGYKGVVIKNGKKMIVK